MYSHSAKTVLTLMHQVPSKSVKGINAQMILNADSHCATEVTVTLQEMDDGEAEAMTAKQ